jgi:hypothetical protein
VPEIDTRTRRSARVIALHHAASHPRTRDAHWTLDLGDLQRRINAHDKTKPTRGSMIFTPANVRA